MDRRKFMQTGGLGLLAFSVGGVEALLTPREARAKGIPFEVLTAKEAAALEALGETLLPGATKAGIAYFVDHHLALPSEDSLLMIRYLDIPPPYADFYKAGLAATEAAAKASFGHGLDKLTTEQLNSFVAKMMAGSIDGWQGPPAPLLYFMWRNDAVDVVYGTQEGYERLHFPYHPHLPPPSPW